MRQFFCRPQPPVCACSSLRFTARHPPPLAAAPDCPTPSVCHATALRQNQNARCPYLTAPALRDHPRCASLRFALFHHDVAAAPPAPEPNEDLFVLDVFAYLDRLLGIADPLAVDLLHP